MNYSADAENEMILREAEKPQILSPTEVLVRIRAVSLNYRDVLLMCRHCLTLDHDPARDIYCGVQKRRIGSMF